MITRDEINAKSLEFGIHHANVQRDYVFGWLLLGLYSISQLRDVLVLKGGNCLRKGYFPNTRFSNDLDFSTEHAVDQGQVKDEFNRVCQFVQANAGVIFDLTRNRVELQNEVDERRRVFDVRLYFKDFFGNSDHITISLSIDITEFDKIYLPTQERSLIHPYSDSGACMGLIKCMKLEEMLANKLKCLLQRQHIPDLFDLIYSVFVNKDLEVNRREILTTFFKKTIYEREPKVARQLLLGLPLAALRNAWSRYIIAPIQGVIDFDLALQQFPVVIEELFSAYTPQPAFGRMPGWSFAQAVGGYFPSNLRNPIMQAGSERRLVRLTYDGVSRIVEPYSIAFKTRKDGHGDEYLYVYDRTGGRSGPGLKSLIYQKVQRLEVLDERFVPRYPIELSKVGTGYFARPFGGQRSLAGRFRALRHGWRYTVECNYCNRHFKRMRRDTTLKPHKDGYGNTCPGRRGAVVDQQLV